MHQKESHYIIKLFSNWFDNYDRSMDIFSFNNNNKKSTRKRVTSFGEKTRKIGCHFELNIQSKMVLIVIFLVGLICKAFNLFIATIPIGFKHFVFDRGWHLFNGYSAPTISMFTLSVTFIIIFAHCIVWDVPFFEFLSFDPVCEYEIQSVTCWIVFCGFVVVISPQPIYYCYSY